MILGTLLLSAVTALPATAQITTGTVTGTVTDAQGGIVPGATVVLTSETQGTKLAPQVTNSAGLYVFAGVAADTYTVDVTLSGFKASTRKGLKVVGGDKVSVPPFTLEPGGVNEVVEVQADIPILQAASGERSDVVQTEQLANLPILRNASSGFREFANLLPGVNPNGGGRLGGGGQDNIQIDGIGEMDTGNNGLMSGLDIPEDSVAEVRVETSSYQAEFGRSSGLQVSAITKSGSNHFHGSVYDIENNSKWNQNSWENIQNGIAKSRSKSRFLGYTIGGPVGKPGGDNKLFFFYAQEYRPTLSGGNTVNARVPTVLERQGNFSQSVNSSNQPLGPIYNPFSGLPRSQCTATNSAACFAGGIVPTNLLYGPGLAVLNSYPLPNVEFGSQSNAAVNYTAITPILHQLAYLPTIRGDYQITPGLRVSAKWTGAGARIVPAPGNFPGYTDQVQQFPWSFQTTATVDYSLTPTTFLEATWGMNQNRLGTPSNTPYSNKNNVTCAAENAGTLPLGQTGGGAILAVPSCTEAALPFPLNSAVVFNSAYYETQANLAIGTPFLTNNAGTVTSTLPPTINYGTNNNFLPSNGVTAPPSIGYPGFMNINRPQNFVASITKVLSRHTMKAGFYVDHSYKAQNFGAGGGGPGFQGSLSVQQDSNNPFDTNYSVANLAVGVFDTYSQANEFVEGSFIYNSLEGYVQDNWKVNRRLTLDYGLRLVHQGPQYDQLLQDSNFFPNQYSLAAAPQLYQPACATKLPCSSANRVALNPFTGQKLSAGTAGLIGQAVPDSGSFTQGVVQAGNGIANTAYTWPAMAYAPRFGAAYDVSGNQKIIVRGGAGLFYDRPNGNTVFSTVTNPYPNGGVLGTTDSFGTLQTLGSGVAAGPVSTVQVFQYDAKVPSDTQWNAGIQMALPWASSVGVSYVGHHQFNTLSSNVDENAVDLGTALLPSGEDPTNGNAPLTNNLLRPFKGYSNIFVNETLFDRTYHSIQTDFTRRYRNGISFGANWTYAISDRGTLGMPGGDPQIRLVHSVNADGSVSFATAPTNAAAQSLFANQGPTRNIAQFNFVWGLPTLKRDGGIMKAVALVLSDWQLSGVLRLDSGAPYDVGYSYGTGGANNSTNLTGSPDYTARIIINNLGALGSGCSSNQYQQISNNFLISNGTTLTSATALMGPQVNSTGLESGRSLLHGCGNRTFDLSLSRTIRLGGGRQIVFRADAFNAPNAVIFNSRGATVNINSVSGQVVTNGIFDADGTVDTSKTKPNSSNAFGVATGSVSPRTIQGQIRFVF